VPIQIPLGAEDSFAGGDRSRDHGGDLLGRRLPGNEFDRRPIPAELAAESKQWRDRWSRPRPEANEELMNKYLESNRAFGRGNIKKGIRIRTINNEIVPMLCGRRQEQGRAGDARRRDRLPALAVDIPPVKGANEKGEPRFPQAWRRRAVRRARVQDHDRPRSSASCPSSACIQGC